MLTGYLRQRRRTLLAFFLFGGIFAAAFALYQLPLRAVAYPFVLCAAAGAVLLALDYRRVLRQHRRLELLRQLPEELADALPPADTVKEADYRSLVTLLAESRRAIRTQEEQRYGDMVDYYTMWAHQIKTPIASMRLTLQNEDSGLARSLSGDLMRVEQYVEMVLVFLRLDSSTTDYVIRSHSLDDIVRPAVRKFAGEFIRRRLRLVRNWVLFLGACAGAMVLMTTGILWLLPKANALIAGPEVFEAQQYDGSAYTLDLADGRLALVNANLPLTAEPTPELAVADDATGQQLEAEAAQQYRTMAEAARNSGIALTLETGYQDAAARQAAFDAAKQAYLEKGLSEEEASAKAALTVPMPEASEYATGYAADILAADSATKDETFAQSRAYEWLTAYAAEYGFILRCPEDRQAATGMAFAPWHWRYVGVENALAIRAGGLSREEFLALGQLSAANET